MFGRSALDAAGRQAPAPADFRFAKALDSLDGDESLFAEIAAVAVVQYARLAPRFAEQAARQNFSVLAAEAHKLKATWSFYAPGEDSTLPERLESAAKAGDGAAAAGLAASLAQKLGEVAEEIQSWLAMRKGDKRT